MLSCPPITTDMLWRRYRSHPWTDGGCRRHWADAGLGGLHHTLISPRPHPSHSHTPHSHTQPHAAAHTMHSHTQPHTLHSHILLKAPHALHTYGAHTHCTHTLHTHMLHTHTRALHTCCTHMLDTLHVQHCESSTAAAHMKSSHTTHTRQLHPPWPTLRCSTKTTAPCSLPTRPSPMWS
jgi:hypothetical protein